MRQLMRLHLANAGYRVSEAADAVVAGHKVLEEAPDLIILDVNLPYMNGLEFAAALTADRSLPWIPILFVTAHEHFAWKAEALGADLLIKPFVKERLLDRVAANLARGRPSGPHQRLVALTSRKRPARQRL